MLHMPQTAETSNTPAPIPTTFSEYHRAAMWLDGEVAKARKGVTTQVVDITPALAQVLLERNTSNRAPRQVLVDSYARDMEHGKWDFNGEPIIVSREGTLNDGQHRCMAIVDTGITVPSILVVGVERETRKTVDQGAVRTISDYLGMDGYTDTNVLSAAARLAWSYRTYGYVNINSKQVPTRGEVRGFISENPRIMESIAFVNSKNARQLGGRATLSFCHWAFWDAADRLGADAFLKQLLTGEALLVRNPILYTRNRLITESGTIKKLQKVELLFRTWNAWRRGDTSVRSLPILGGALPVLEK